MNYKVYTGIRGVRVALLSLLLAICSIPAVAQPAAKVLAQIKPGWHWFKYMDNDPNVLAPDPSNSDSNKGIVNVRFKPDIPLLEKMKELNIRVYHLTNYYDDMESQKR